MGTFEFIKFIQLYKILKYYEVIYAVKYSKTFYLIISIIFYKISRFIDILENLKIKILTQENLKIHSDTLQFALYLIIL